MSIRADKALFLTTSLAVLALAIAVYWPGLNGDFMFDDFPNILQNPQVDIHSLSADQLSGAALSSDAGPLHRPLAMVSFALNRYFFGPHPYSFKVTNLAIHLMNGILVLWLAYLLLSAYRRLHRPAVTEDAVRWTALAVAAAWLVHPLNLTAVLYIVQRMTSLSALFTLAAVAAYTHGRLRNTAGEGGNLWIWLVTPACGVLGLLCKENAALIPFYLLTVECVLFRFRGADGRPHTPTRLLFIGIVALPLAAGITWICLQPERFLGGYAGRDFTLEQRLLTEPRIVLHYIQWTLFPNVTELALYHDDIRTSTGLLSPPTTLISIFAIAAMLSGAFALRRRLPLAALGILWFFAGQLMESTFYPLELAFEHRNYVPDFGILLAVLSVLMLAMVDSRLRRLQRAFPVLLVATLALLTWTRADEWRDNADQAYYEAVHHPDSPRAVYSLGRIYANLVLTGFAKSPRKAYTTLERAQKLDKDGIMPDVSLIIFSTRLKRPLDPKWIHSIQNKLANDPISASDIRSLHELVSCVRDKCKIDNASMFMLFRRALHNPTLKTLNERRADLLSNYANFLTNSVGDFAGARRAMIAACRAKPSVAQYHINLAHLLLVMGKPQGTAEQIAKLRALDTAGDLTSTIHTLDTHLAALRVYLRSHSVPPTPDADMARSDTVRLPSYRERSPVREE